MTGKMYFDISRLGFEGRGILSINDNFLVLSNDDEIRTQYCTGKLIYEYGTSITRHAQNSVFAYSEFELSSKGIVSPEKFHTEYLVEFHKRSSHLKSFLIFLWFVKDNSVGLYGTFGQIPEMKIVNGKSRSLITYMSDGTIKDEIFTRQELERASDLTNIYSEIRGVINNDEESLNILYEYYDNNESGKGIFPKTMPGFQYSDLNAIDRAIHFLLAARSQDYLFYKIAYYIPVFECLFSSKGADVTYRVSIWAASYLTNDPNEREKARKDISDGYDIRSRFIHGQEYEKDISRGTLLPLSKRLDHYLRIILTRSIEKDAEIFTKYSTKDKESYLNSLLLGIEFDHEPAKLKIQQSERDKQKKKKKG